MDVAGQGKFRAPRCTADIDCLFKNNDPRSGFCKSQGGHEPVVSGPYYDDVRIGHQGQPSFVLG